MSKPTGTTDGATATVPGTPAETRKIPSGGSVAYPCTSSRLRIQIPLSGGISETFNRSR